MKYVECINCGKFVLVESVDKDSLGWHSSCPKCGGSFDVDLEDFLLEKGARVRTPNGKVGVVMEAVLGKAHHLDLDEVSYRVRFDEGYSMFFARKELVMPADWRLTRRDQYGVSRECHYPKNQEYGNVHCYNCADRTKCNADIFERLAQYEDTGLLPEEILKMKEKMV